MQCSPVEMACETWAGQGLGLAAASISHSGQSLGFSNVASRTGRSETLRPPEGQTRTSGLLKLYRPSH